MGCALQEECLLRCIRLTVWVLIFQGLSAEQDALSVELEQQEVAAQQLTHALATERTIPGELPSPSGGSPPWGPAENLERLPTEAVLGQEWADDVQAARAAQEEFTRSIAADAAAVPRYDHCLLHLIT